MGIPGELVIDGFFVCERDPGWEQYFFHAIWLGVDEELGFF